MSVSVKVSVSVSVKVSVSVSLGVSVCESVSVSMSVCPFVHGYARLQADGTPPIWHAYTSLSMHTCIHTYRLHIRTQSQPPEGRLSCILCACMYDVCVYVYTSIHKYVYIYIYIYTHKSIYLHKNMHVMYT